MLKIEKRKIKNEIELNIYKNNKFIACISISEGQTDFTLLKNSKMLAKKFNLNELEIYKELIKR